MILMLEFLSPHHIKITTRTKIFLAIICTHSEDALQMLGDIPGEANLPNPLQWDYYKSMIDLMMSL